MKIIIKGDDITPEKVAEATGSAVIRSGMFRMHRCIILEF